MPQLGRLASLFCFVLLPMIGLGQGLCPSGAPSDKLICLIPQVFGANGLILPAGPSQFQNSFTSNSLIPLNSAIVRQSVLLPLASPSSGITFSWDPSSKTFVSSADSLGPIFAERAETIGKYRAFVGFDYQYLKFDRLDNFNLRHLPEVFTQPDNSFNAPSGQTCSASVDGFNSGPCAYIRDVVKVNNSIDLKIYQFITFFTFGLTNRIDVSLAVPITNVRMGIVSDATIVDVSATGVHAFEPRTDCGTQTTNCLNQQFPKARNASGIGDITLRVKGTAWKGERAALAIGVDVRAPTGDSLNFLGAGAAGVKPFVVWSYRARFSPHLNAGFEVNGSSRIAGNIVTGTKERLPSQFTYTAGTDVWLTKRLTAVFDLVGQQVFQAQRLSQEDFTELGACMRNPDPSDPLNSSCPIGSGPNNMGSTDPNLSQTTRSFNVSNISLGSKLRPFSNLVITANVLIKVNNGGLRSRFVPLAGLSYTF
jgi:hypothetical protein